MQQRLGYRFDAQKLGKRVREKRGDRPLRVIETEIGISISILSRIENAKLPPDYHNLGVICGWLGENPGNFFVIENPTENNPIAVQLRAAQKMSAETASAFMDLFRAAYMEILEQISEDEKA
jgi:transcriptional regulator with XRE-family HTH domain